MRSLVPFGSITPFQDHPPSSVVLPAPFDGGDTIGLRPTSSRRMSLWVCEKEVRRPSMNRYTSTSTSIGRNCIGAPQLQPPKVGPLLGFASVVREAIATSDNL